MPRPLRVLCAAAVTLLILAQAVNGGTIRHDQPDSAYLSLGAQSQYDSVGWFYGSTDTYSYYGSGTLIAPNWALTAAHVVDGATSMYFKIGGRWFSASRWFAHPLWDGNLTDGYDIGLVQFGTDLSRATGTNPVLRYSGSGEIGNVGTSVGFGATGTGATGVATFDGQRRAGQNVIDTTLYRTGRVLLSDFDNPSNASDSSYGSSKPLPLEYLIGPGDSGGGVFIQERSFTYLAGVHSFGWGKLDGDPNSDYGDVSGHIRVSYFNDWIDSVIGAFGTSLSDENGLSMLKAEAMTGSLAVPEPGSLILVSVGSLLLMRRRPG